MIVTMETVNGVLKKSGTFIMITLCLKGQSSITIYHPSNPSMEEMVGVSLLGSSCLLKNN